MGGDEVKILVVGGAGYIGSHMVKLLASAGHEVVVFDNLSTGHRWAVKWGEFVEGDLLDPVALQGLFGAYRFDAVMHFSASSLVGESMQKPALYWRNNVEGALNLLDAMLQAGVSKFVFSSTAATFGNPVSEKICEDHPQIPINPYGQTKLTVEKVLSDYAAAYGFCSVSLRYFNAAGADPEGEIGEGHNPETHLIPNVLKAAKGEGRLKVFGRDYPTPDGTCVRDYIHVNDLCQAHLKALEYMPEHDGAHGFNLGNGQGFSILEIIDAARQVTGIEIPYDDAPRRDGDPPVLVADSRLARQALGWSCHYSDIKDIIETAWNWHKSSSILS